MRAPVTNIQCPSAVNRLAVSQSGMSFKQLLNYFAVSPESFQFLNSYIQSSYDKPAIRGFGLPSSC